MKKLPARFAAILLAAIGATAAHAEPYIGGSGGRSEWSAGCDAFVSCDKRGGAWTVRGGYRFNPYVALEARYVDLGNATTDGVAGASLPENTPIILHTVHAVTGTGIDAVFTWPFYDRWSVSGMAGFGRMTEKVTGSFNAGDFDSGSESLSSTKPWYGVSLNYDVGFNVLVSFEAERYRTPSDVSSNVDLYAIGLTYRFR